MKTRLFLFALCLWLTASPALGQFASPVHLLPVVAKIKGQAGTDWVTDVAISNLSGSWVALTLQYFPEARDNPFPSSLTATITLDGSETRIVADVLGSLFPQVGGQSKGALLIMARDPSGMNPEPQLAVTSRTYNNFNPDRTYGQTVPSTLLWVWGGGKAVLTGVRQDSRFRTNIGVVNLSMGVPNPPRLKVKLRIFGPLGGPVRELTQEIPALSLRQWNLAELGVSTMPAGRVEVTIDPADPLYNPCQVRSDPSQPGAAFLAYYSKVDNATGDAEFGLGQIDWSAYQSCPEPPEGDPCK